MITTSGNNEKTFDVGFMICVVDKSQDLVITECNAHFGEFVGIDENEIAEKKLSLYDLLLPIDREAITRKLCKNTPYIYHDFHIKNSNDNAIFVHACGHNFPNSTLCCLTLADISSSVEKTKKYKDRAKEMNHLIDLVGSGVALFKVHSDMHFSPLYLNEACCRILGTTKELYRHQEAKIDEFIHPEDRSSVFQAIGKAMATKSPINLEIRIMAHKDKFFWCKMDASIHRYDNDGCPIFHAVFTDINDVKLDEEEADRQNDLLVRLFKNLPDALFYTSLNEPFKLQIVSSDFMKLIGYSRAEMFEKMNGDLRKIMLKEDIEAAETAFGAISEGQKAVHATYSIKTKKGDIISVFDKRKIIEVKNEDKHTIGILSNLSSASVDGGYDN